MVVNRGDLAVRLGAPVYDHIGAGYATYRCPEPRWAARIHAALGDARTVINVGAGPGSYEPADRSSSPSNHPR